MVAFTLLQPTLSGPLPVSSRMANADAYYHLAMSVVALAFGMPAISDNDEVRPAGLRARTVLQRQLAMYLLHTQYDFNMAQLGRLFGRDRSTVSYSLRVIEDQRDAPAFDARLLAIEGLLGGLDEVIPK